MGHVPPRMRRYSSSQHHQLVPFLLLPLLSHFLTPQPEIMSSEPAAARGPARRRLHYRRSRNGCWTCKRRKVRCNEQRPLCYHCERLNLECVWKDTAPQRPSPSKNAGAENPPGSNIAQVDGPSPDGLPTFAQSVTDPTEDFFLFQDIYLPDFGDLTAPRHTLHERVRSADRDGQSTPHIAPSQSPSQSSIANVDIEDPPLPLHVPPILDPVENGPKCASLRALFGNMATLSSMVRYSIAAFAAIQSYTTGKKEDYQPHYDRAANELSKRFHRSGESMTVNSNELRYVLTTIFFLTYINVRQIDLARHFLLADFSCSS